MFITVEGLDGSGGTTQVRRLVEAFAVREPGREVVATREPSPGPIGMLLRKALMDETIGEGVFPYLFAADRRDHLDRVVLPALARGAVVISDRYALSSFAYQAEVVGEATVRALNAAFPVPDLTILLDLDPMACMARMESRLARDRFEQLDRLRGFAAAYDAAVASLPEWRVVRIDASQTPDAVAEAVAAALWAG